MSSRIARFAVAILAATALAVPVTLVATAVQPAPASPRVAAGGAHACAITSSGGAKCWGANDRGQLGDGSNIARSSPVQVAGLTSGVTAIAASHGSFTCALTSAGAVKCWGFNQFGQLGNGSTTDSHIPVSVAGLSSGVSAVAVGDAHACALMTAGGVKCWGSAYLTFANNQWQNNPTPVDVPAFPGGVTAIATGVGFTCVLTTAGGVKCWGDNHDGELGNGDNAPTNLGSGTPVDVSGLTSGVVAIASHWAQTCALTSGGGVKCWGQNHYGELGNGATGFSRIPVDVTGLASGVTAIATGYRESCAVTSSGGVKCWGSNLYSALGDPAIDHSATPLSVPGLASGVRDVTVGQYFACALMLAGGVKCWGNDSDGELGNGDSHVAGYGPNGCPPKVTCATPVDVIGLGAAKPDGRIRLGTGAYVGNNIYNATGVNQSRTGSAARGGTITFGISVENDGTGASDFKVKATGSVASAYTVTYLRGTTDITAAVVAGTYRTPSLAPAANFLITAKVTVKSGAAAGSSVSRLVTITSSGDATKKDAVTFIGKRA
jgi:alpha-tubulin suppressor-like RCC1 family protein